MPSSLLVFLLFAVLLSLHLNTFFYVFYTHFCSSILDSVHSTQLSSKFKVALRMHTYEENGVAHEAIVIEWAVSSNFEFVKKRWGRALLSVKCCCFVQTPS